MSRKCLTKISDLDMEILKLLNISDINTAARVCQYLWHLISRDEFWRRKFLYDYEFNDSVPNITFKNNYKRLIISDQLINHFWLNQNVSTKRKPNKALTIPLCTIPADIDNVDTHHTKVIAEGRVCCANKNSKPNLWGWLMDQLSEGSKKEFNFDNKSLLNFCWIPLRKGDIVVSMNVYCPEYFFDGINFIRGFETDHYSPFSVGVPTEINMFWPEYKINYFSNSCLYVPLKREYVPLFKINKTYGVPPLTWDNGYRITDNWYYSWISISSATLYLLLNTESFAGNLTPDLFDSAIDHMGYCESACQKYVYMITEHLDTLEQNIIIDFDG